MLGSTLTFGRFAEVNRLRCESVTGFGHFLNSWSASDWMTALVGEVGEAANIIKKLNRCRDGISGNKETREQLKCLLTSELADTFIYLDLLCQSQGVDLGQAVIDKFNATSDKLGCLIKIK